MKKLRAATIIVALAGGLAGCGDDDSTDEGVATETTETTEAGGDEISVTAVDYRFEGLPDELPLGTTLTLQNESTAELHELVLLRLPDDEDRSVNELLALPEGELEALFTAPPALVLVAPPGEDGFVALGDGAVTEAGRYVAVCFIPTGADPQAYLDALEANPDQPPAIEGGPPHLTAGMYQQVTVR